MRNLNSKLKASILAMALAAVPTVVVPAGLGKLSVQSGIGQPLRAEIDVAATAEELSSLSAKLASPDAFKQAGIELTPSLSAIKFSVAKRPDGKSILRVTSDRPMNDPFLEMLIELNWATGRVVREYKVLLDPPEAVLARQAPPPPAVTRPTESRPTSRVDDQTRARAQAQAAQAQAQPGAPSAQPSAPAAQPAAPAPREPRSTYEVRRGDTLNRVARQTKYDGVSLDQMLVALFRSNRDAFDGNNMHRLKAGKILNVPDRETVAGVQPGEARRVVVAQSADFNAYRRKLASAASAAPASKEPAGQQIAGGKITPRVEDKAPMPSETKDQLKVSKAEAAKEAREAEAKAKADKAVQSKIASLEEEVIAKDKALKEATSRLSQVEKNIQELQKLIELKNKSLAELQKQAAAKAEPPKKSEPLPPPAPPVAVAPTPAPVPAPTPAPAVTAPAVPAPAPVAEAPKPVEPPPPPQVTPPPPPAPAPAPVAEVKPEPPKPAPVEPKVTPAVEAPKKAATPPQQPPLQEPGFIEGLLQDQAILIGGGGVLALILGYVGYKLSRRRREEAPMTGMETGAPSSVGGAQSVFGATGGQSVDTSASSLQTDFSQSGIGAIDADEGVDPVAEADVYMAYGRDAQAEEILLDALKNDPTRHAIHVKLLEIYAQRKNLPQFETLAGELYAQTNGVGPEWEKAAALGRKLDPSNPLYGGGAGAKQDDSADATIVVPAAVASAAALKDTWTMPGELGQIASQIESHGPETSTVVLPLSPESKSDEAPVSLDFDLGAEVEPAGAPSYAPVASKEPSMDFQLGAGEPTRTEMAKAPAKQPDIREAPTVALEPAPTPAELAAAPTDIDFKLAESSTESQPPGYMSKPAAPAEIDLLLTTSITGGRPMGPSSIVDLEATDFGGNLFQDLAAQEAAEAAKPQQPSTTLDLEKTEVGGNLLDFDFDLSEPPHKAKADGLSPAVDLSGINLELGGADQATQIASNAPTPAAAVESFAADAESAPEADTKLELAQAYEEMGDKEGARELLQEVLKEGSSAQQDKARGMLAKLS